MYGGRQLQPIADVQLPENPKNLGAAFDPERALHLEYPVTVPVSVMSEEERKAYG